MDWAEFIAACIPEPDTITGEAYDGSGAYGDVYAAAVTVTPCYVEHVRRQVRATSSSTENTAGSVVTSETTVFCPLDTNLPPGSRVTLPDGRVTRVITTARLTDGGNDLPEHVELACE